jgi:hypothetical protein
MPIHVRAITRREIVDDKDIVAACEKRVDNMAPEETRAAGHKDAQLRAAPFRCGPDVLRTLASFAGSFVDEPVEEMVDNGPSPVAGSKLPFSPARGASAA